MIKKTTASIKGHSFGIGKRSISVLLALLLLVGTFAVIPFFTQAGDSTTTVFSILAEAVGTEKPTEKYWSYNIHEYSEKPSFVTSDKNFKAPDVGFTDDGIAVISWESYSGADGYTVNIYDSSNTLVLSEKTGEVTYNVPDGIFTQGAEYQLQITAVSGNDTVAGSMIRPYKYSAPVEFADIATNLNGKNMRDSAAADDAVFERTPDGVDSLAVKALAVQDSFYYTNISKLPSDTQAVAYWVGQTESTDGSYYSLNFRHDRFPAKPASSGICYYVPTNGDPVHTGGFQTNSYQSYTDNKHGDFVEGWVVIPLSSFGDSGKQAFLDAASLDLQLPWAQYKNLISSDGARLSNGNLSNTDIKIYCSNVFAISDVESFLKLYVSEETDNSYAAVAETDFAPDTYSENYEYYNTNIPENKFVINNSGGNYVRFTMTDDMSGTRGMQLTFTAPEDGYYDLTHKLAVVNNLSAAGTVYYRVVKNNDSVIYPADTDYCEIEINGNNPTASLTAVDFYLSEGEKLTIEAYAELTAGNSVTVDLGYTTVTRIEAAETSKGFAKTYNAADYYISNRISETMTAFAYMTGDRIEYKMADFSTDIENPTILDAKTYNASWSANLYYVKSGNILGYYNVVRSSVNWIKTKSVDKVGLHVAYNATESGTLSLKMPIETESSYYNVRVVKNGEQIWPDSGYATVSNSTVLAETKVKAGDEVAIQLYSAEEDLISGYILPEFTLTDRENGNSVGNLSYSPLWERPYSHKADYSGEYVAHPTAMFDFKIVDGTSTKATDSFNSSKDNFLYCSELDSGYSFTDDNLIFTAAEENSGASIDFTAPYNGKYELSMPIKILDGEGTVEYKVSVNGNIVYPESGTAQKSDVKAGDSIDFPALLLELSIGDKVNISVVSKSGGMKFDFGTPLFHRFDNVIENGSETIDVYTPYIVAGFEEGRTAQRLAANARFEFIVGSAQCTVYDSEEQSITNANGSGFVFTDNGAVTVNITDTALTHILRFTAAKELSGDVNFSVSGENGAQVRLLKDGVQLWPESGYYTATAETKTVSLPITADKGSVIEWEIKADTADSVCLGVPNVTDYYHLNDYTDADTSYPALGGNPFGDKDYEGNYKRYDNELWLYDIAETTEADFKLIVPDKYDSADGKYLYSSKTNTGYRFGEALTAELKDGDKNYGISLGFTAPRTDSFTLRTGLSILTENAEATLYVRILHNGETVWAGENNDWYTVNAVTNQAIEIPLKYIDFEQGDTVQIQIYAEDILIDGAKAENIEISLVRPEFFAESIVIKQSTNIKAALLYPYEQFQYANTVYSGRYTHMENRWNYEFIKVNDEITYFEPDYYDGTYLYNSENPDSPKYNLAAKTVTLNPADPEHSGVSLRFTPAMDAEVIFMAVPTVTSIDENTTVKFRIIHNGDTVWPKEGLDQNVLSDWEALDSENPTSLIADRLSIEMLASDEVYIELYADTTAETAEPVTVSLDLFAATVYRKNTDKLGYSFQNENTDTVQLDPFWSYEYSLSRENIKWERLTNAAKDGYYSIPGVTYNGINYKTGLFGMTKHGILLSGDDIPVYAIAFTAPLDGYYTLGKFGIINYGEYTTNFKYRITVNESTVWPSSGWCVYTDSASADVGYQGLSLELSADDVVRFEVAATDAFDEIETNARYRVKWMISINYSQWEQMYNSSDDIYNMLALDMVDYFKALAAESGQFDIDYDKHYAESLLRGNETDDDDSNQNDAVPDNSGDNTDSENGKWIEGTEDEVIYTPGIIRKQIKKFTTVEYPVLMIVLICVAAVLVIAAIVIIIILHKKGKIHWFKKKSKTSKNK